MVTAQWSAKFLYKVNSPARKLRSDDYHEQSHCCYPNNQKRQCSRVVIKPMFVHAQRSLSIEGRQVAPLDDGKLNRLAICCCTRATPGRESEAPPCYQLSNTLRSPFRHGLSELEAVMAHVVNEVLLYCFVAAFVTGIVIAAASLIS